MSNDVVELRTTLLEVFRNAIIGFPPAKDRFGPGIWADYAAGGNQRIPANDYDVEPQANAFADVILSAITPALIEKALNAAKGATRHMHKRHLTTQ